MGPEWERDTAVRSRVIRTRWTFCASARLMRLRASRNASVKACGVAPLSGQPQREISVLVHVASGDFKKIFSLSPIDKQPMTSYRDLLK